MAFYGYSSDTGEYHWSPNFSIPYDYDASPTQSFTSYSYSNSQQIEHNSNYNYCYTTQIPPELSYSVHNFTEPKLIADSLEASHIISYSTKQQDDTVFEEYDPTPYSGGYDMVQTYGKPLPPSSETCYPRSLPKPNGHEVFESFDYGSIPSPYVNHDTKLEEPLNQSKVMDVKDKANHEDEILEKPTEQEDQDFVVGNGTKGEYGHDYGSQLQQIPYGSGLEAVDLCESLFGYWPCLANQNQTRNIKCDEDSSNELWKSTADYIFGNPIGYGGDERYGVSAYGYQNFYYQLQP